MQTDTTGNRRRQPPSMRKKAGTRAGTKSANGRKAVLTSIFATIQPVHRQATGESRAADPLSTRGPHLLHRAVAPAAAPAQACWAVCAQVGLRRKLTNFFQAIPTNPSSSRSFVVIGASRSTWAGQQRVLPAQARSSLGDAGRRGGHGAGVSQARPTLSDSHSS